MYAIRSYYEHGEGALLEEAGEDGELVLVGFLEFLEQVMDEHGGTEDEEPALDRLQVGEHGRVLGQDREHLVREQNP